MLLREREKKEKVYLSAFWVDGNVFVRAACVITDDRPCG